MLAGAALVLALTHFAADLFLNRTG